MSREDVERVRDIFVAVGRRGDLETAIATMAPDVEWDMSRVVGWPEEPLFRGPDAVRRFLEGWRASWSEWHFDIEEIADLDDRVFVAIREWGLGADSGAGVEQRRFLLWRLHEGRTVRVEMFSERSEAVEAARLGE